MNTEYISYLVGVEDGSKKAVKEYKDNLVEEVKHLKKSYSTKEDAVEALNKVEGIIKDEK